MSVGAMDIARECWEVEQAHRAALEPRDALGRKQPRRLDFLMLARAVPGLMGRFKRVPAGYVECEDGTARVWCSCLKSAPAVETGGLVRCQPCGRFYLFDGRVLWVAQS